MSSKKTFQSHGTVQNKYGRAMISSPEVVLQNMQVKYIVKAAILVKLTLHYFPITYLGITL